MRVIGIDVECRMGHIPAPMQEEQRAAGLPSRSWRDGTAGKVALLQIAASHLVVLIPVNHLAKLPPALTELLASHAVCKVGHGCNSDCSKLTRELGLACPSTYELHPIAKRLRNNGAPLPEQTFGLAKLAAAFYAQLDKRKIITLSDWEESLTASNRRSPPYRCPA